MSELLATIKKDQLAARLSKDKNTVNLLTTLLGEASPSGNQVVTDSDVLTVVIKFVNNLKETRGHLVDRGMDTSETDNEIEILSKYLPRTLSQDEISDIIDQLINEHDIHDIRGLGTIMKYFSLNHKGQYSGESLSNLVKSKLNPT